MCRSLVPGRTSWKSQWVVQSVNPFTGGGGCSILEVWEVLVKNHSLYVGTRGHTAILQWNGESPRSPLSFPLL